MPTPVFVLAELDNPPHQRSLAVLRILTETQEQYLRMVMQNRIDWAIDWMQDNQLQAVIDAADAGGTLALGDTTMDR